MLRPLNAPVLLLLCLAALPLSATGTITGTVVDAATRVVLRDIVVEAWTPGAELPSASAKTDATGLFVMRATPGEYRLLAYDPAGDYATAFDRDADSFETTPVTAVGATSGGGTTHRADFALVRGGRAAGLVNDVQGRALSSLVVAAYNPSGTRRGFTTTNSDGSWSILLPPGSYRIAVYDPGERPVWATMFHPNTRAYADAKPVGITVGATAGPIDLSIDRVARLEGEVRSDRGVGVEGVSVYAYTAEGSLVTSTRTDFAGVYRLAVPPGPYRLVAADPRKVWATLYYPSARSFARAPQVALAATESRFGVDFTLARAASITGRVTAPSGPLAGLDVGAFNADGTLHVATRTAADGTYALTVAPGELRIAAWDPASRWVTRFHPAAPDFNSATFVNPVAGSTHTGIDVNVFEGGQLKGMVRDAITKLPIPGAAIAAYDVLGTRAGDGGTGADGRYVFAAVPGDLRLVAFDPLMRYAAAYPAQAGSFDGAPPATVTVGRETLVDFELKRGVIVVGSIADPWGNPLGGIEVFALDDAGRRVASATSAEGAFAIVLLPGRYHFVAVDPLRRFAPRHYPAASTFDAGSPVDILNGPNASIALSFETAGGRRRAARH